MDVKTQKTQTITDVFLPLGLKRGGKNNTQGVLVSCMLFMP
jgi:hypothetical protein